MKRRRGAAKPLPEFLREPDLVRSCTSKHQYASEAEARAIALMNGMKLSTYHCTHCDFYHLTRRPSGGPSDVEY